MCRKYLFALLVCMAAISFSGCNTAVTPEQIDYKVGMEVYKNAQGVTEQVEEFNQQANDFQKEIDNPDVEK